MPLHLARRRAAAGVLGLALVGSLNVGLAASAEAVPRPVPINGTQPKKGVFFIKGFVGADYANKKVKVQRKLRPGAGWDDWKKAKTSKAGKYKVRIYRIGNSPATCYRVKVKAFGAFEKGKSKQKCVIRIVG